MEPSRPARPPPSPRRAPRPPTEPAARPARADRPRRRRRHAPPRGRLGRARRARGDPRAPEAVPGAPVSRSPRGGSRPRGGWSSVSQTSTKRSRPWASDDARPGARCRGPHLQQQGRAPGRVPRVGDQRERRGGDVRPSHRVGHGADHGHVVALLRLHRELVHFVRLHHAAFQNFDADVSGWNTSKVTDMPLPCSTEPARSTRSSRSTRARSPYPSPPAQPARSIRSSRSTRARSPI